MLRNDSGSRSAGSWRDQFLSRHRRSEEGDDLDSATLADRSERRERRSLSRQRSSRTAGDDNPSNTEAFDQRAVLDQDRALIEQLTKREPRAERGRVRKPPPPPKVSPYRGTSVNTALPAAGAAVATSTATASTASSPTAAAGRESATPTTAAGDPLISAASEDGLEEPLSQCNEAVEPAPVPSSSTLPPITAVPLQGELFTSRDIDHLMSRLDVADASPTKAPAGVDRDTHAETTTNVAPRGPSPGGGTQNFGDISEEFYRSHGIQVPQPAATDKIKTDKAEHDWTKREFVLPDRSALKEQIQSMSSWFEEDNVAGPPLPSSSTRSGPRTPASAPVADLKQVAEDASLAGTSGAESEVLRKLEAIKQRKVYGEKAPIQDLRELAGKIKPLLPTMKLERLVQALQLFASARFEDHDLYLRILGEIPVQVRGISPVLLTTCLRVLRRLALPEETYLELFSMEAMNMIRAKRKPQARAPRRPPAVGAARQGAQTSTEQSTLTPKPPPARLEDIAPFSITELIHIGNSLTILGAKHPARFMDVFQEQLAIAIPQMSQQECELVSPCLALSQLMPDNLRRQFLDRCAAVNAGEEILEARGEAAPDIAQYQREAADRRRRVKHYRNIFVFEASVRKETFSFFSSLSPDVRKFLDRVHEGSQRLPKQQPSPLALQVATVLDQLGVTCDVARQMGPLTLHVVAKATNPRAEVSDVIYECNDVQAYYALRKEDKGSTPVLTVATTMRHRLLQRLGAQLVHINIWEWQSMSEAQRVNYMVKLQSL